VAAATSASLPILRARYIRLIYRGRFVPTRCGAWTEKSPSLISSAKDKFSRSIEQEIRQ
jgi:hypothetical protein